MAFNWKNTNKGIQSFFRTFSRRRIIVAKWQFNAVSLFFLGFGAFIGFYLTLSGVIPKILAADTTDTWNFSVSGDYTPSDANTLEVASSSARLKVQNYANDANTAALYHLDESSGNAADSSSNANTGTVANGTYSAGSLNNALGFNGSTASLTATDSASLSLTGNFSLEAWTKFNSSFSTTSNRTWQGILDKGPYQMYYDNETGKVVFEMAPSSANQWAQVAGPDMLNNNGVSINTEINRSWDANSKNFVWNQVVVGSDVYVALGSATTGTTVTGDAEVWKCTVCATSPVWSKIGGDGLNGSWDDGLYEDASSIVTDGTNIYTGIGNSSGEAEVWRYNGSTWTKVGGDTVNSSWLIASPGPYERVTTMAADGTTIYAGLGTGAGDAEVWKCTSCDGGSPTWSKVGGDGSGTAGQSWATSVYEEVSALTIVNGTTLAVGLGTTAGDAELWTCTTSSCTVTSGWTKRGGDATGSGGQSWTNAMEEIRSLTSSGTVVYVGIGVTAGDADVWRCDLGGTCTTTAGWTQVGGDTLNSSWAAATYERVWSLVASGTTVYAGIGDTAGDAEVWSCANCATTPVWTKLGGDGTGINGQSWGNTTGASFLYAASLSLIGTNLFVGASSGAGTSGAEVWTCNTAATCNNTAGWTRVAGQYLNKSWGMFNLNSVESMTTIGGKLYAGTGYDTGAATANSNATVWEFDGTNWTMIGGQGINSSWTYGHPTLTTITYRSITSMTGYNGTLIVGLGGGTNGDAEVWRWNGTTWTKIGGDGTGAGGQSWAAGTKRSVTAMTVIGSVLYAGLQGTAAGDGEMWTCDLAATCTTTAGWTLRGGDATGAGGQSWNNTTFEAVWSFAVRGTNLYVGLGSSAADAEVWSCDTGGTCTQTAGWTKLGGDTVNSSWANATYEEVTALSWYRGELYAGLGASTGDAELWKWNGTNWGGVAVAGDSLNGSWTDGLYERIKSLTTYNGDLIVGLGDGTGEGEVWRYNTSAWSRIGGDGVNSGWTNIIERISAMAVYRGKLYAGTGLNVNSDATIWAYGGNILLESTTTSQDTNWHHLAVTYNGSALKLYIDGVEDASISTTATMSDTVHPLLLGTQAGSTVAGRAPSSFAGMLDEVRISNIARASFNTTPYTSTRVAVQPTAAVRLAGTQSWDTFSTTETANGGTITYRLSDDGGTTWKYWDGAAWVTSSGFTQANDETTVNTNISTFPVTEDGFLWQAVFLGNGNQRVTLNEVIMQSTSDLVVPAAPNALTALDQSGGIINLTTNTWYTYTAPYFSWSGASDAGSGIAGYYVYFGTDNTADPQTAGTFQAGSDFTPSSVTSGQTYYLRLRTRDNAQNVSPIYAAFIYKLDSTGPQNPTGVTVAPTGYSATNDFTFFWTNTATDAASGVAGYQYQVGASVNLGSWSSTIGTTSVNLPGAAYQTGENLFHLRTLDNAGNASSVNVQVAFYYSGTGPTAPQNVDVSPASNSTNSFAFSWDPPSSYSGDVDDLTYCYTVNTLPSEITCSFTSAGATSIAAGAFATQVGTNTFYVVAKNADIVGGAINYGAYDSVTFVANTSAPGIPLNVEIADVSVKSTSSWKIALSWEPPSTGASSVQDYEIFRSINGTTFTEAASTTGIAFVDTGLLQQRYYYKVRACDNVHNCGSFSTAVELLPSGRFTTAAELSTEPKVSLVTTRSATISWGTDRTSDSKIQYGKGARSYFSEEPSNSDQLTDHEIKLSNLSPGTRYYFKAKWTDEDGNTGVSTEDSFETLPAPTVTDPQAKSLGLSSVVLEFTAEDANSVRIYYGTTASFGSVKQIATSTTKTTYDVTLDNLLDGTKYFYKINTLDSEEEEYDGSTLSFETLPRPKISNVRIQQVRGSAQTVMLVSWSTNTETSSIVTYYPEGRPEESRDEVNVKLQKGEHKVIVRSLVPQTPYVLVVKGRDKAGNEAGSDSQRFTTATDNRPPQVIDVNVEGSVSTKSTENTETQSEAQLVVSWSTDEQSTSQVEYGEGTGSTYSQKTQEDGNLVTNHTVIISGLTPSKVYHVRVVSRDKASNVGNSVDTVAITPKATANALDLVITSLRSILGQ
ncbi:MAG: LamG-like jellyroll fold domain-containing protein [Candidatus Moraniibacteriota bacterium]